MNQKKYKLNKGFISQNVENEMVIFDGEQSVLFSFNETAAFIFKRISKGHEPEKIIKAVTKTYDISEETAKKDMHDLVTKLTKKNIIVSV